jgi:predicted DNA-binding transcriptional regulator AlpA
MTEKMVMTIPEVSATLGISRNSGYKLARCGELPVPVIKLGKRLVVSKAAIEKLLQGNGQTNN